MANIKSAKKRILVNRTKAERNKSIKSLTPEPEETEPSAPKNRGKAAAARK